jgi:hypothetical protein
MENQGALSGAQIGLLVECVGLQLVFFFFGRHFRLYTASPRSLCSLWAFRFYPGRRVVAKNFQPLIVVTLNLLVIYIRVQENLIVNQLVPNA